MTRKIGICTLSIGEKYRQRTKGSLQNKVEYCAKYGYDLIEDDLVYDTSKHIAWSKINLILKYLDKYDYLVWIDADILIMNDKIKLESFIDRYSNVDIICGSDWRMINTGILFVKNTEWSRNFLTAVYNNVYDPEADSKERYKNWEQGSFIHLHDNNYLECRSRVKVTDPTEFNSYWYNYFPGHFALHFAGVRGDLLMYLLRDYFPNRSDMDTDESYSKRMEWLAGPVREHLDNKLRSEHQQQCQEFGESEPDMKGKIELKLRFPSKDEFSKVIAENQKHLDALMEIVKKSGEELEGNYFYKHQTFELLDSGINKQINLYSIGQYIQRDDKINVMEIGFNAGHSALLFLLSNKNINMYCFDICIHSYTIPCFEYLSSIFPGRLHLIGGSSIEKLPEFYKYNSDVRFDIIHIDGNHDVHFANCDFFNSKKLAKSGAILIFDDIYIPALKMLWNGYIKDGHIDEVINILPSDSYEHVVAVYK